jgi:hypothetical protein
VQGAVDDLELEEVGQAAAKGGTMAMARSDIGHRALQHLVDRWNLLDIAPMRLELAGVDLLVIAVYMRPGPGVGGCNSARYQHLASLITTLGGVWTVFADWNATPQELRDSGWTNVLGADIWSPEETTATCNVGAKRHIDFVVASKSASALFKSLSVISLMWFWRLR